MFAGGIRRVVGEWAYLGVHQITTTYIRTKLQYRTTYRVVGGKKKVLNTKIVSRKNAGSYKTYEMSKAVEKRLAAYLNEMGVGQGRARNDEGHARPAKSSNWQLRRHASDEAGYQRWIPSTC